jgi:hypothetical protein
MDRDQGLDLELIERMKLYRHVIPLKLGPRERGPV